MKLTRVKSEYLKGLVPLRRLLETCHGSLPKRALLYLEAEDKGRWRICAVETDDADLGLVGTRHLECMTALKEAIDPMRILGDDVGFTVRVELRKRRGSSYYFKTPRVVHWGHRIVPGRPDLEHAWRIFGRAA